MTVFADVYFVLVKNFKYILLESKEFAIIKTMCRQTFNPNNVDNWTFRKLFHSFCSLGLFYPGIHHNHNQSRTVLLHLMFLEHTSKGQLNEQKEIFIKANIFWNHRKIL